MAWRDRLRRPTVRVPGTGYFKEVRPQDSREHEEDSARALGHRRVRGSGSSPHSKSDARERRTHVDQVDLERMECKKTGAKSMSIKLAWLEKIAREALATGRVPVVALRFERAELAKRDWILVERDRYVELKERAGEGIDVRGVCSGRPRPDAEADRGA